MSNAKFVVLTSSRTGSTWLIDLLNLQSGVEAHGELFLNQRRLKPAIAGRADYPRFIETRASPGLTRVSRVFSYLNRLYRAPRTAGFKLMYAQLRRYPEILVYLAARRIRIVHLTRCNHIDVIISEEVARLTGSSHARVGTKNDVPRVRLDQTTLVDRIRKLGRKSRQAQLLVRFLGCPVLETTYEALLQGEQEFARILKFLDLSGPVAEARSNLAKRATGGHRDAIVNYDEVRQALISTPFSNLLR